MNPVKTDYTKERRTAVIDTECFCNYWSLGIKDIASDRRKVFELYEGHPLDIEGLRSLLQRWRTITFNGNGYDWCMIAYALSGATNSELKRANDSLIVAGVKPWEFMDFHEIKIPPRIDTIDIMEVAPGAGGLKIYGGRCHSARLQDLPYDPDRILTPAEIKRVRDYLWNDLQTTQDLYEKVRPQIALREEMSNQYGIDLRSKSDAQIAEAVIRSEIEKIVGKRIYKPDIKPGSFYYKPPEYVSFRTQLLKDTFKLVRNTPFIVQRTGKVEIPKQLDGYSVTIGDGVYRMGNGGLHSSEECRSLYSDDEFLLRDSDVASYYPSMIIENDFIPKNLGRNFLSVYGDIYKRRLAAKRSGDKTTANALKITLNGAFGKLSSPYSTLYSPDQLIQVTLTGQLSLLMLIERLELAGIPVVSANTDGVTASIPREKIDLYEAIIFDWECDTGMTMEFTDYSSTHSANVNNYIAVTTDGDVKRKGLYAAAGLSKNPAAEIATDAVVEYLTKGAPIERTIERCRDLTKFLTIRQVRGGGVKGDKYLGKVVRWYYAEGETDGITYETSGNMVPKSIGAKPCMDLPDEFPEDIDYEWYIREAYAIMKDMGVKFVDPHYAGRSGIKHGRLPDQKSVHLVDMSNGTALCGKAPPGPRVRWIEFNNMPDGHRLCSKCRREDTL